MNENIISFSDRKKGRVERPSPTGQPEGELVTLPKIESGNERIGNVDRAEARALVEAGYMPLEEYVKLFGTDR